MKPFPDFQSIRLTVASGIATLTLARPEVRNAIDDPMREELVEALRIVSTSDAIRALVLTGDGKGFCAGGDIAGMQKRLEVPPGELGFNGWRRQENTYRVIDALYALPKPSIAAVNGAAAGVGCDLALCCDFIVASEMASFSMSFILRGLVPDAGMYLLPRRVGIARAKELALSGRRVPASEALQIGLADRVATPDTLLEQSYAWAAELAERSPAALALTKQLMNQSLELDAGQVFERSRQAQAFCFTTAEHQGSVAEFLSKAK